VIVCEVCYLCRVAKNPYSPGVGTRPPYLAGRAGETRRFKRLLDAAGTGEQRRQVDLPGAAVKNLPCYHYSFMSLNIKDPWTNNIVRELPQSTGETITQAVEVAVTERLDRLRAGRPPRQLADELDRIALRCAALPLLDDRADDEILGYDKHGLPS
jgi:antitoxin VapB